MRNDASAEALPVSEQFWQALMSGRLGSFHHEFLVSAYDMDADWQSWEMHPKGDEIVCLLSGRVTFVLALADGEQAVELSENGAFLIVPKGTWHTAKVHEPSHMLFITAGEDTQHRPLADGDA